MEPKTDELADVVARLIKLTQDGVVTWVSQPIDESLKQNPDDQIGPVFAATYSGKNLRIYRRRYKYVPSPSLSGVTVTASMLGISHIPKRDPWNTDVILEIVDERGLAIWTFPSDPMLRDLLSVVRYEAAGVKEFLDSVLREG